MRPRVNRTATLLGAVAVGFALGWGYAIATQGFRYEVRDQRVYESPQGPLTWRYVTRGKGLAVIDPGTTEIEFQQRIIYSAKRDYQESSPFARDISFDGKNVSWSDGDYHFRLVVEPIAPTKTDGKR